MKATPITAKASALKQTYNPDLVIGAYNSSKKFQDHGKDLDPQAKEKPESTNDALQELEIDDETTNNEDEVVENNTSELTEE